MISIQLKFTKEAFTIKSNITTKSRVSKLEITVTINKIFFSAAKQLLLRCRNQKLSIILNLRK